MLLPIHVKFVKILLHIALNAMKLQPLPFFVRSASWAFLKMLEPVKPALLTVMPVNLILTAVPAWLDTTQPHQEDLLSAPDV